MTADYVQADYLHSEQTAEIIASAQIVHAQLGPGFGEVIYQRALALELPASGLEFEREVWIDIHYRGKRIGRKRVDFIAGDVMVELKAKSEIEDADKIQTLSYLKASGFKVGLLLNFGGKQLHIKRFINTYGSYKRK
jgi:GxxExxY protein